LDFEPYVKAVYGSSRLNLWKTSKFYTHWCTVGQNLSGGGILLIRPYKFPPFLGVSQWYFVIVVVTARKVLVFVINIYIHVIETFTL
jgi:hypothetical protein